MDAVVEQTRMWTWSEGLVSRSGAHLKKSTSGGIVVAQQVRKKIPEAAPFPFVVCC
jgi:hypothetical protein